MKHPLMCAAFDSFTVKCSIDSEIYSVYNEDKKAVLPQGNRAMPQVFFSVEVRQQHSLQV